MPNQPGEHYSFDYQETPGVNRTASATESHVQFPGQHDSEWMVKQPNKPAADGPYSKLTHYGTDGSEWRVWFHCTSGGGSWGMNLQFETERTDGQNNHKSQWIGIVDWDVSKWKVSIPDTVHVNPYTPKFILERGS